MVRVHQGAGILIILFSLWVIVEAQKLTYMTPLGPGPGYFPFWLAVMLGGLSAVWVVQLSRKPVQGRAIDFVPSRAGIVRIVSLMLATATVGLFLNVIGFSLSMFALMMFLLIGLGRVNPIVTLIVALVCSFGIYWIFTSFLDVQLPVSSIEFIKNLGF